MLDLTNIQEKSLQKRPLSAEECLDILNYPEDDLLVLLHSAYKVRSHFVGKKVQVQMLMNAKSGYCTEDCHYCSQSGISHAEIEKYPLRTAEKILEGARFTQQHQGIRYCMALSGIRHSDATIDALADAIALTKEEVDVNVCCSLGFLTESQAEKLKHAGLDRINHNLNSSEAYYPEICTTHTYKERIENLLLCKSKGLEICSGGIIGLGERQSDVVQMLMDLKELEPQSIPLNFLIPIKGTLFEDRGKYLTPAYCLKVLCLARFLHPDKDIRVAGGREFRLRSLQPLALYPANSIFVSGYLTTDGQPVDEGIQMIYDLGFEVEIEGTDG